MSIKFIDCTLRDGGYYNNWDFSEELVLEYFQAMSALDVDFIEIGFRSTKNKGFKGGYAYSNDDFIQSINVPITLKHKIGVMINGSELLPTEQSQDKLSFQQTVLNKLFKNKKDSPVTLIRIACQASEFIDCLPAGAWLKSKGYLVGFNVMQIANCSENEIKQLAKAANTNSMDVLYFADSMGSLDISKTKKIIELFKQKWTGELGIHAHNNMGQAMANTIEAIKYGVTWLDSTVMGMGRGAGNVQTEYLIIALSEYKSKSNPTKLFELIRNYFKPLQNIYNWGINPYYFLAGKFGIHPIFIQEMLADVRYNDEDIIAAINYLITVGSSQFDTNLLNASRNFYIGEPKGSWNPFKLIKGRDVLILGSGPGGILYKKPIEIYIKKNKPFVIGLNLQRNINRDLIDVHAACHPIRLLADCSEHLKLPQPLIAPLSMLPKHLKNELVDKELLDFGIEIKHGKFELHDFFCTLPAPMVFSYALAIASCGKSNRILLAGFDGYSANDPRNNEMNQLIKDYQKMPNASLIVSITPTKYEIASQSIFAL